MDFTCEQCGESLAACDHHGDEARACLDCGSEAKLIGVGGRMVGSARWFRCTRCRRLHMLRRGELVKTGERAGTREFGSIRSPSRE